ncbi:Os05g0569700 [Oryza sativa Japonica Group]|uniref:CTP synthase n=1 Tax=Oryza sativa subsp. japonica TaxID=39947 RepID=Q0DFU4_ORYSJ|nr:Os05g0569700 [Oryza sativa Japonica Group]|eukprot:NP_001056365.1 Os05g0569700 [Oryza sativa Japonica Group]
MKYVVVMGGVISGLGKGVTASSIGVVLKACGLRVTSIKIDPYFNADAGTISPHEHGEVFVLDDGGEVDLDLGNYERFLDIKLTRDHSITAGKIHHVIPHITNEIQDWIERIAMVPVDGEVDPADVYIIELGGTIGDIESTQFIEAFSQFSYRVGAGNLCVVHVGLVPVLNVVGEQELEKNVKEKLSLFCHVPVANIFTLYDVSNIWRVPLLLRDQKADQAILKVLNLESVAEEPNLEEWMARADLYDTLHETVRIAMVGKYTGVSDTYLSVMKAPDAYSTAWSLLRGADGILVPGGFGERGVEGKILAAKHARENDVPFLGICLGMQLAVVEFACHVLKLPDANSTEFDAKTENPCVIIMPECSNEGKGGTMRRGSKRTFFKVANSKSAKLYGSVNHIDERFRHRYQVNPNVVQLFENNGLQVVGTDKTGEIVQIVEIPNHRFFVGVQFHPEFMSRPSKPSALFVGLIAASCGQLDGVLQDAACNHEPQQNQRAEKRPAASDLGD